MDKEYIERGEAIEMIRLIYCKDCNSYNGVRCRACEFDDAMSLIEDVPAADVVEVVRCKDCVYWDGRGWDGRCEAPKNGLVCEYTNYDDYCSYGKRKDG